MSSTLEYLRLSANIAECSSSAKTREIIRLAKIDVEKGTTISELVYWCCYYNPKKEALQQLIELETESEERLVRSIFEFRSHQGINCLMSLFQMPTKYTLKSGKLPFGPLHMLQNIEDSFFHLISLAKSSGLDLEKLLNHTMKNGDTLIAYASIYCEKVTMYLREK